MGEKLKQVVGKKSTDCFDIIKLVNTDFIQTYHKRGTDFF